MPKAAFEITQYDPKLRSNLRHLKRKLAKDQITAFETHRGVLETELTPRAPAEAQLIIEYGRYAVTFILSVVAAGFFGQVGADTYTSLKKHILGFLRSSKVDKDILLMVELVRERDFPLKLGFVIPHNLNDGDIMAALNLIPTAIKITESNIDSYKGKEVLIINFVDKNWDLENIETRVINHGTTQLTTQRTIKLFGIAEKRYMPQETGKETNWEYIYGVSIPKKAEKNALKHRTAYYQRLYTGDEIKYATFNFGSASISFDIFESFLKAPNGFIPMPKPDEKGLGQHCVATTGYTKEHLRFVNSWGVKWGDRGQGYLTWEYVDKYVFDAWGANIFLTLRSISIRNFWRLNYWKLFKRNREQRKFIKKGSFRDKRGFEIGYKSYAVAPINPSNGYLFIIDIEDPHTKITKGWAHFTLKDNELWLEELFIGGDSRNLGWGSSVLREINLIATSSGVRTIKGWVSIEDCKSEHQEKMLNGFFRTNGFSVYSDDSKFRGCILRIEKEVQ